MKVEVHPEAVEELEFLPPDEQRAMQNAFEKLEVYGDQLPFPHGSKVKGADALRELRPRAGRSPWRAFYRRVSDRMIIAAFGPEANVDPSSFRRSLRLAEDRLSRLDRQEQP